MKGEVKQEDTEGSAKLRSLEVRVKDCDIHSVVVYQDRAEVKRLVHVELCAGENVVTITGLAECIDENSIRVEGKGNAAITDVIYSSATPKESTIGDEEKGGGEGEGEGEGGEEGKTEVQKMEEEIQEKLREVKLLEFKKEVIGKEKRCLKRFADHICKVHSVKVSLEAPSDTEADLIVSYIVSNASWSSAYDVRVFTNDNVVKIQYYGMIKQTTGEDWVNTRIALSTAQPSVGGSAPALSTHTIKFKRPPPRMQMKAAGLNFPSFGGGSASYYDNEDELESCAFDERSGACSGLVEMSLESSKVESRRSRRSYSPPRPMEVEVTKVKSGLYNTTYSILRTTSIPADSTEHKVTVALFDLKPDLSFVSVPRMSPYCFLQAKTKNTSEFAMLAGPSNVFLDNNFIAKSTLPNVSPNEDFTISLGADQAIRVTIHPLAVVHGSSKAIARKANTSTLTHVFDIKNTKANSVVLQVSEQVPLSNNEKLKVTVLEPDLKKSSNVQYGTVALNQSNNLEWKLTIPPDTEVPVRLVYSVEYPINLFVQGLPK